MLAGTAITIAAALGQGSSADTIGALGNLKESFDAMEAVLNFVEYGSTYKSLFQFSGGNDAPTCSALVNNTVKEALPAELRDDGLDISATCAANLATYSCELLRGDHIIEETFGSADPPLAVDCIRDIQDAVEAAETIEYAFLQLLACVPAEPVLDETQVANAKTCADSPLSYITKSIEDFSCMSDHPVIGKVAGTCFGEEDAVTLRGLFAKAAMVADTLVQKAASIANSELSSYFSAKATVFKQTVADESRAVLASTGLGAASVAGYAATVAVCAIVGVIAAGLN